MARVIVPASELDMASAPHLGTQLFDSIAAGHGEVVVDLSDVRLIDSAGIGVLLSAQRRAQAAGTGLVLANPSEHVLRVLSLTGVERRLTVRP
jgi:anti-sigma B factor antagonist